MLIGSENSNSKRNTIHRFSNDYKQKKKARERPYTKKKKKRLSREEKRRGALCATGKMNAKGGSAQKKNRPASAHDPIAFFFVSLV